jgi:peptidoglycan-associated lipoprotein
VANIPGGSGGFDVYYAPKKRDGVFGLPVNVGAVINTPGEEASPFYQDGKLYFSSNGHASLGGLDVFESQWNGAVWSAPVPLPAGINTSLDDQYYTRSADGFTGFLVSNRPGPNNLKSKTCCDDIYAWEIERIKVELLATTFRMRKKDEKANPPLEGCTVQVIDVTDKDPLNIDTKTNAAANDFAFTLLPEKSYIVIAEREGYTPDTLKFNTAGVKKTVKVEKKLTLRTKKPPAPKTRIVKRDEPIRLNSIYYDFDKADILPASEKDLQFLVNLMNQYPDMKIELSSHTDAQGRDDYNERLSQRRADSARTWMIAKGIVADRIVAVGSGEKFILNRCKNGVECPDEEHRFNRRTEFKITAGPTSITIEEEVQEEDK